MFKTSLNAWNVRNWTSKDGLRKGKEPAEPAVSKHKCPAEWKYGLLKRDKRDKWEWWWVHITRLQPLHMRLAHNWDPVHRSFSFPAPLLLTPGVPLKHWPTLTTVRRNYCLDRPLGGMGYMLYFYIVIFFPFPLFFAAVKMPLNVYNLCVSCWVTAGEIGGKNDTFWIWQCNKEQIVRRRKKKGKRWVDGFKQCCISDGPLADVLILLM